MVEDINITIEEVSSDINICVGEVPSNINVSISEFIPLTIASEATLGVIKVGENLSINNGILSADAQIQIQSDYNQIDNTKSDYIKNKPDLSIYAEDESVYTKEQVDLLIENIPTHSFKSESDNNILKGQPIYIKSNGHIELAIANSYQTSKVSGLLINDVNTTFLGEYINNSIIFIEDWTNIIGTQYLTIGDYYYLSPDNAGKLINIAPIAVGQYIVKIGQALTENTLQIQIEQHIKL